ncbi:MAG TPA: phosphatase PAP2 family protein [Bacteroidota bacterium]|jgi:membrane-associated phospholipid phosphatase|nr:phosphatase PAP2 family protein [Bacteroidota bacterium]
MRNLLRALRPVDVVIIVFAFILSLIILLFAGPNREMTVLLAVNASASVAVMWLARSVVVNGNKILRPLYNWYPVPVVFLVFKEVYVMMQAMPRGDWDEVLIALDRAIFGVDPTVWLGQFSNPLLTELLQIAYVSYYFIMIAVGVEVLMSGDQKKFSYVLFAIMLGFFLSYFGYIAFPAVGPRFTLHNFGSLETELPGLVLTAPIRDFLNAGESIPKGAVNALALAQRDAFPSGHTQMTLISLYLASHYRLRSRYVLHVCGILLIISTVYLRYHYVIDVVAGVLFAGLTLWISPRLFAWWEGFRAGFNARIAER